MGCEEMVSGNVGVSNEMGWGLGEVTNINVKSG